MRESRRKHSNSGEDPLFREAVRDVRPLKNDPHRKLHPEPQKRSTPRRHTAVEPADDRFGEAPDARDIEIGDELAFRRPHVTQRTLRRLRRGYYPVQRHIDLHGLTAGQAAAELGQFIAGCRADGISCIRVVHGKGLRSGNRGPVLKAQVARVLSQSTAVLAYVSTPPRDGGTGACYVLLRSGEGRR